MARSIDALQMLRREHRDVQSPMRRFGKMRATDEQDGLRDAIVEALRLHTRIEEEVFYPYLLDATGREDLFQEADVEHGLTKELVEQLAGEEPGSERIHTMNKARAETVAHHVREEEEEIFPAVGADGRRPEGARRGAAGVPGGDDGRRGHDGRARKEARAAARRRRWSTKRATTSATSTSTATGSRRAWGTRNGSTARTTSPSATARRSPPATSM